jgi:transcription elongation factor Elf1
MAEIPELQADEIKDTDIIFDCPHCSKSLAIDYRGAGLTINCSDCGEEVEVPIPEGMEIGDVDSTQEDRELQVIHLRRSLQHAQDRIVGLEEAVEDLLQRRDELERQNTQQRWKGAAVDERLGLVESALQTLTDAVRQLALQLRDDTQEDAES